MITPTQRSREQARKLLPCVMLDDSEAECWNVDLCRMCERRPAVALALDEAQKHGWFARNVDVIEEVHRLFAHMGVLDPEAEGLFRDLFLIAESLEKSHE